MPATKMKPILRVAVLASGGGTDFQSIIDAVKSGKITGELVGLITDNPAAGAIERAKKAKIPVFTFSVKNYSDRVDFDRAIRKKLDELKADLVVLAGYMKLIKDHAWITDYFGKMVNIHPSLLPAFPGGSAQADAFKAKVKVSGYTIHFVDESLDGGPVVYQEAVPIYDCKSADEVVERIKAREHVGLPSVVASFAKGRYEIKGKKVAYFRY